MTGTVSLKINSVFQLAIRVDVPGAVGAEAHLFGRDRTRTQPLAVDGNRSGVFAEGSVTHTGTESGAWIEIDLGESRPVGAVQLWNRTEVPQRLSDYWLTISNNSASPVTKKAIPLEQTGPDLWQKRIKVMPKPSLTIEQRLKNVEKEKTPDRQAAALLKIARAQFAKNDESGAKETAAKALEKLKGEGDANLFAPRLVEVAGFLAEIGDRKPARESLGQACGLIDTIDDPVRKAKLFAEAGAIYKANTDSAQAKETLKKAADAAASVEERFRANALAAVALGYSRSGMADAASDVVDKLLEAAKTLEEPRAKAEALSAAAEVQAQTGKKKEAGHTKLK